MNHSSNVRVNKHNKRRGTVSAVVLALIASFVFTGAAAVWAEPAPDYLWEEEPRQSEEERAELIAGLPEELRELAGRVPADDQVDPDTLLSWPFTEEIDWETDADLSPFTEEGSIVHYNDKGEITFASGIFGNAKAADDEEAQKIAEDFMSRSEALEDSELLFQRADVFKNTISYTFYQTYDGNVFADGLIKVITDRDGAVLAIASSLISEPDEMTQFYEDVDLREDLEAIYDGWETDTYSCSVESVEKGTQDVSVPVVKDPETGDRYLVDLEREIICTDYQDQNPICVENNEIIDSEALTFSVFIRVYDYFQEKGWTGPDGQGTPCMLMFDTSGESNGNASYGGCYDGYQYFNFGVNDSASQNMSVLAHEFMHGVSHTNRIGSYINETGALDEAISDMIGNAVDADVNNFADLSEDTWLSAFLCDHIYENPLYIWDEWYTPVTMHLTVDNDWGNVHKNSSIISIMSYRLAEAGMTPSQRFDYWMTFDLTITPVTDFAEIRDRLKWCAWASGMPEYAPVLVQAAKATGLGETALPGSVRGHQCLVTMELDHQEAMEGYFANLKCFNTDKQTEFVTWAAAGTNTVYAVLAEGNYIFSMAIEDEEGKIADLYVWNGQSWENTDEQSLQDKCYSADSRYIIRAEGGSELELIAN